MQFRLLLLLLLLLAPSASAAEENAQFRLGTGAPIFTSGDIVLQLEGARGELALRTADRLELVNFTGKAFLHEQTTTIMHLEEGNVTWASEGKEIEGWTLHNASIALRPGLDETRFTWTAANGMSIEGAANGSALPKWLLAPPAQDPTDLVGRHSMGDPARQFHLARHDDGMVMGAPRLADPTVRFCGAFQAIVQGGSADISSSKSSSTLDLDRQSTRAGQPPLVVERIVEQVLILEGTLQCTPFHLPPIWELLASDAQLAWTGALRITHATGWIESHGKRIDVQNAEVLLAGRSNGAFSFDHFSPEKRAQLEGSGRFDQVLVNGKSIAPAPSEQNTAAVAATTAGVAAVIAIWLLYHRIGRNQVLDHPLRQQITELVTAEPGLSMADISRKTAAPWGTVRFHVAVLARAGVVQCRREGRVLEVHPSASSNAPRLSSANARAVLDAVPADGSAIRISDIAKALGISRQNAGYHLARLCARGLVDWEGRGKVRRRQT